MRETPECLEQTRRKGAGRHHQTSLGTERRLHFDVTNVKPMMNFFGACTSFCVKGSADNTNETGGRRASASAITGLPVEEPKKADNDAEEEEEEEDDDYVDEIPETYTQKGPAVARSSVSAEAYGAWNKKTQNLKPPVIAKNPAQEQRIRDALAQAFMFAALDERELKIVVDAFKEHNFTKGDAVIKQYDDVTDDSPGLFVLEQGELAAYKRKTKEDTFPGNQVYKYGKTGESFGELALLYNAPRAATVMAEGDCTLWSIDRATFNHMVKDAAAKKRNLYDNFLSSVDLLKSLDSHERGQIADALRISTYKKGDTIIKEGESGIEFYIVEVGEATAYKGGAAVMNYKKGDYFGELALINNKPRAATVTADSDVKCVTLDRGSFKRLLGPLDAILKERAANLYNSVAG